MSRLCLLLWICTIKSKDEFVLRLCLAWLTKSIFLLFNLFLLLFMGSIDTIYRFSFFILFMGPSVLFQLPFDFIYHTFRKKCFNFS